MWLQIFILKPQKNTGFRYYTKQSEILYQNLQRTKASLPSALHLMLARVWQINVDRQGCGRAMRAPTKLKTTANLQL